MSHPGMIGHPVSQEDLFDTPQAGPEGFVYRPTFIDVEEEASLLECIRALPLRETPYKQYTARRRTVSYGADYAPGAAEGRTIGPLPDFLYGLRARLADWMALPPEDFVQALVSEYRPGTPLGWHRDMPDYEAIAGVSLGGVCRMSLRPYRPQGPHRRHEIFTLDLQPRSAYQIRGPARWSWQHSIAATAGLRYSITFRTARRTARKSAANSGVN